MSVTASLLKPPQELAGRQAALWARARALIQRHAVHVALLSVALAVFLFGRLDLTWSGIPLNVPSTQPNVVIATPSAPDEEAEEAPAVAPTVIPDVAVGRVAIPHTYEPDLPSLDFVKHVVEKGDTPNKVAELYGIEPATLLWGNPDLSGEAQLLQVGITLTILPVDGVLHTVGVSDTAESIAAHYGVEPHVIIDYADNYLEQWPHRPVPGTQILVPGGEKQYLVWSYTPNSTRGRVASAGAFYEGQVVPAGLGHFIWPTWGYGITQYYWWGHRAIDIGAPIERPVSASDNGTVIFAGWSPWGYGYLVVLDHGNGFQTYYAHLNSIWVANGQYVPQGMNIGGVGSTGNSSGSHLHFEIRYNGTLLNPLDYLR